MKLMMIGTKNGRKCWNWSVLLALVMVVHVVVIGVSEAVWFWMSGGVSPLVAGFSLMASWLILIRVIGGAMASHVPESYLEPASSSRWD